MINNVTGKLQFPVTVSQAVYHNGRKQSEINEEISEYMKSGGGGAGGGSQVTVISDKSYVSPTFMSFSLVNHRGGVNYPENTIPGYENAAAKGFNYFEADIKVTKDNVFVLLHDDTIDRTSNGTGKPEDKTLAQLKALDFGSWKGSQFAGTQIPTLEEYLLFCKKRNCFTELDCAGRLTQTQMVAMYELVRNLGMTHMVDICAYDTELQWLLDEDCTNVPVSISLWNKTVSVDAVNAIPQDFDKFPAVNVSVRKNIITSAISSAIHSRGWRVKTWTLEESAEVQPLIDVGCDTLLINSDALWEV